MLHSLRVRLLLALLLAITVAVGSAALFSSQLATTEFRQYLESGAEHDQGLSDLLAGYPRQGKGAQALQTLAERAAEQRGERVLLINQHGRVLGDSAGLLHGQMLNWAQPIPGTIAVLGPPPDYAFANLIAFPGATTVELSSADAAGWLIEPAPQPRLSWRDVNFIHAINRSLFLAALAASLVAILLSLALSRRILRPIATLTTAVQQLEQGNLAQRVQVHSNDEIGMLTQAFNSMADRLARLKQLRHQLVTDVAHELRTPLMNVRGYLEAVRDGVVQQTPALIDLLYEEVMLLNRLVDDLHQLTVAESGQLRLLRQPVALAAVVDQAVSAIQPLLPQKGLAIEVDLPAALPLVDVDRERIGQVLRNLLNNAMTHTPAGGAIHITACATRAEVLVSVRDSGVGIAPEHLDNIFERFFRADRSRTRATGGAGLGLTIVKQLVEAHGGRIWAQSRPQAGAEFTFSLPLAAPAA